MRRRVLLASPLLLLAARARAADAYPEVMAGHALQFPQDYGSHPAFRVVKLAGLWRPGRLPDCFEAREVGSLFVSWAKL